MTIEWTAATVPVAERGYVSAELEIGPNCWVGAKAVLVRGSGMQENCVFGAAAVLTRNLSTGPSQSVFLQSRLSDRPKSTPAAAIRSHLSVTQFTACCMTPFPRIFPECQ